MRYRVLTYERNKQRDATLLGDFIMQGILLGYEYTRDNLKIYIEAVQEYDIFTGGLISNFVAEDSPSEVNTHRICMENSKNCFIKTREQRLEINRLIEAIAYRVKENMDDSELFVGEIEPGVCGVRIGLALYYRDLLDKFEKECPKLLQEKLQKAYMKSIEYVEGTACWYLVKIDMSKFGGKNDGKRND